MPRGPVGGGVPAWDSTGCRCPAPPPAGPRRLVLCRGVRAAGQLRPTTVPDPVAGAGPPQFLPGPTPTRAAIRADRVGGQSGPPHGRGTRSGRPAQRFAAGPADRHARGHVRVDARRWPGASPAVSWSDPVTPVIRRSRRAGPVTDPCPPDGTFNVLGPRRLRRIPTPSRWRRHRRHRHSGRFDVVLPVRGTGCLRGHGPAHQASRGMPRRCPGQADQLGRFRCVHPPRRSWPFPATGSRRVAGIPGGPRRTGGPTSGQRSVARCGPAVRACRGEAAPAGRRSRARGRAGVPLVAPR